MKHADAVGNRLSSLTVPSLTYNSSNELISTSRSSYTYDYNGNLISKSGSNGATSYAWDYENRLASVTLPGSGGTVSFKYDPFGRRIQKSGPAGTTNSLYDGANIVADLDVSGAVLARYTQGSGIDEPLASVTGLGAAFFEADGLGSVTSLSGASGATDGYTYKPFGITTADGSNPNRFRFTGREWDQETGLYYYRARYHDPSVGRFISEDPTWFHGGINFYAYVGNNPTHFIDPTGLAPCLNIDNFTRWLDDHTHRNSQHNCASAIRHGLEAGGLDTSLRPTLAKDYGPFLENNDFAPVSPDNYTPQKGDIVVIQPGPSPAGHIEAWDGNTWVSDFTQNPNRISPYRGPTPSYTIYRTNNPCPPTTGSTNFWQNLLQRLVQSVF